MAMKLRYQRVENGWAYDSEYELTQRTVRYVFRYYKQADGPEDAWTVRTNRTLATPALAAKYLRWSLSRQTDPLIEGEPPALDANESFQDVKDKTKAYRYFVHPRTKHFVDLETDASDLILCQGTVGTPGTEERTHYNWEGELRPVYKAKCEELVAAGYVLKEGKPMAPAKAKGKGKAKAKPAAKAKPKKS